MWTVIVACHHWCVKLRHICNTAETLLVVRDGNSNGAVPCSFSASGLIQGYHVYQRMWMPHRRKTNYGKRSRKWTRPIHFQRSNAIEILNRNNDRFLPGTATLHTNICYTTSLVSTISEAEHPSGACWSSLQYSFSPAFFCYRIAFIDVF